jgi:hypothetical protein
MPNRAAAVIVRTCPRCGVIKINREGVPPIRVSLRSERSRSRAIVPLSWRDARFRGRIVIRVVSRGRPVFIDGIAVRPVPLT